MKRRAVAFMSVFVLICTVISVNASIIFSNVEIVRFDYDQHLAQIDAQAHACPPSLWGKWVSHAKLQGKIKQALRTRLIAFQERHEGTHLTPVSFEAEVISNLFGRHPLEGCTTANSVYKVHVPALVGATPRGPNGTLKVGVRDGYPMISQLDAGVWHGAAVVFAKMIGTKLRKHVQFVQLDNANQRLSAVRNGVVDVVISLLSSTDDRATQVALSEPYFTTGLVIGTTNIEAFQSVKRAAELSNPSYKILVASGTTAETYARAHFPRAQIETVHATSKIKTVLETMRQAKQDANVLFITDEIIAAAWDVVTLELDGQTLLTEDERYVVAVQQGRTDLLSAINTVIRAKNISQMYADLSAR